MRGGLLSAADAQAGPCRVDGPGRVRSPRRTAPDPVSWHDVHHTGCRENCFSLERGEACRHSRGGLDSSWRRSRERGREREELRASGRCQWGAPRDAGARAGPRTVHGVAGTFSVDIYALHTEALSSATFYTAASSAQRSLVVWSLDSVDNHRALSRSPKRRIRTLSLSPAGLSMPTLPPTFVSLDSDDELFHHPAVVADVADSLSSPTPDPDLDDGVLVSVVTGDGVGAITSPDSLAHSVAAKPTSLKPRLDLSDLSLHSPSSILGTPFDVSPRFEYPFPPSSSSAEPDALPTSLNPITSPFLAPFPAVFLPTLPSSMPFSRPEARCHSPTHPKLQPRDPPVPPHTREEAVEQHHQRPPLLARRTPVALAEALSQHREPQDGGRCRGRLLRRAGRVGRSGQPGAERSRRRDLLATGVASDKAQAGERARGATTVLSPGVPGARCTPGNHGDFFGGTKLLSVEHRRGPGSEVVPS